MSQREYAGFIRRSVAFLLDLPFLVLLYYLCDSFCVFLEDAWSLKFSTHIFVYVVFVILYFAALESSPLKATYGKVLMGIQVEKKETSDRLTFSRALLRFFVKILSILFVLLGIILILFTRHKQALHDIVTGSVVIKE